MFDIDNDDYRSTYGDDSDIGEKDVQPDAGHSDDNASGDREERRRGSEAKPAKENTCQATETCTGGKCPGCRSTAQPDTETATSKGISPELSHKEPEQQHRRKRLTGTCKERKRASATYSKRCQGKVLHRTHL
ncbi:hypothetical protein MTO96_007694 [Rhipicephalus appendiculatus]